MSVPHSAASSAVLVGSSRFADHELLNVPSIRTNIHDLAFELSLEGHGFLASSRITSVIDKELAEVGGAVRQACATATDLLVVYYAGHGHLDHAGELYLSLPGTSPDLLAWTAMPCAALLAEIDASPARQRILILDCCYAGRAALGREPQEDLIQQLPEPERTFVLAATPAHTRADAPVGARYTAFTGELIELLRHGAPGGPDLLDAEYVCNRLQTRLARRGLPAPCRKATGGIRPVLIGRNPAVGTFVPEEPQSSVEDHVERGTPVPPARTERLSWVPDPAGDVVRRLDSIVEQAHAADGMGGAGRPERASALLEDLIADASLLVAENDHHVVQLKIKRAGWLRRAGAIDDCLEVCEDVLSGYDELDLDNRWTRAVVIDYAHVLGESGDITKANEYVDLVTAETDGLVNDDDLEPVVELRLARIEWERRGGDLEQAARLAADLLGYMRVRNGFSGELTWQVERVYTKLIKKIGQRRGLRLRLRAARTTAGTILKDNW
ncbi:caspase domain-containing protein [Amycolatopsis sp. lyj-108]|uniref:caspase family protein n=1 Tax=Amycolatopsis sp. lyj-108 TaxID=2789286 RepID=UPI003979265E